MSNTLFSKLSISRKVMIFITSVLILILLGGTIFLSAHIKHKMSETYIDSVQTLFRSFQAGVDGSLERGQMKNFKILLSRQKNIKGVMEATLYDREGKANLSSSELSDIPSKLPDDIYRHLNEAKRSFEHIDEKSMHIISPLIVNADCVRCHLKWREGEVGGSLSLTFDLSPLTSTIGNLQKLLAVGSVFLALIICIAIAMIINSSITKPITRTVNMIEEMSRGRLDSRLNMKQGDEIGQMAKSMDQFAETLQNEVVMSLQMLAACDLTFKANPYDQHDTIGNALLKTGNELNLMIGNISLATEHIAAGAEQVAGSSQELSQGATESAASLEQITSSMTELASQTKANAENAAQANNLSLSAKNAALNGSKQMTEMTAAMKNINDSSREIAKIIKAIDDIAFQTNLLALNAAVEAARAGKHGKGFAVVAQEVRNLAGRSAKAARETAELIEDSMKRVENGSGIMAKTAAALTEIVDGATKVADLVGEIAAASNEQARGINQINQGLTQIERVTHQNTANSEQTASAAEELSSQAVHLREIVAKFKFKNE
ncbi:MAG: HAMP domain-containing protein [Deltaproteobacteria bacterium]|nr:HAMP domain-containing protein [Deltaproteobacteria bacterium]